MTISPLLDTAISAARAAEAIIRRYYAGEVTVRLKADQTPVTAADVESEEAIRMIIRERFPDDWFLRRGRRHGECRRRVAVVDRSDRWHQEFRASLPLLFHPDRPHAPRGAGAGRVQRPLVRGDGLGRNGDMAHF